MSSVLEIVDFMAQSQSYLTIDVRSPAEYLKGHIPHAVNLPLFTNEERAVIGTLYKQKGKNEAIEMGLEIVGPKMADFARFAKKKGKENKIYVYCWRGGMRSGSMAWLWDMLGYDVYILKQGYKAYRHYVLEELGKPIPYTIIGGKTGSGKTALLYQLQAMGEQIIDLEGIAHHKGSAFGALGQQPQPTTEQFENLLQQALSQLDTSKRIWLEDESKNIGSCYIPNTLWAQMRQAPLVVVELPIEVRVARLVQDYGTEAIDGLEECIKKIERRLGNEAMKEALKALHERDLATVARITLRYYDEAYDHGLTVKDTKQINKYTFEQDDMVQMATTMLI